MYFVGKSLMLPTPAEDSQEPRTQGIRTSDVAWLPSSYWQAACLAPWLIHAATTAAAADTATAEVPISHRIVSAPPQPRYDTASFVFCSALLFETSREETKSKVAMSS